MQFTNIYYGKPESLHNARVLRQSNQKSENNNNRIFPNRIFILGDSVY